MTAEVLRHAFSAQDGSTTLFEQIRDFLLDQRLSPDPRHYEFAHRLMTDVDGALARSVQTLIDGGFRLSASDIEILGGEATAGSVSVAALGPALLPLPERERRRETDGGAPVADPLSLAAGLVARTQMQVEGFTDMMLAIRAETEGFGRDLAASADAIRDSRGPASIDEVVRLTSVMLARVQTAESKLADATKEACELRAKLEEARDNARRDPLTELPNRRAFEEAFTLATTGQPIHIAVCDVDRFKSVNDRFGHAVGDRVLKAIATALTDACEGHLVARYGGEEFGILFVGVERDDVIATLEAARLLVAAKRFRVRESKEQIGSVTVSAGMTHVTPGEALPTAFARADRLLYDAKNAGRNALRAD